METKNAFAENDIYTLLSLLSYHEKVIAPLKAVDDGAVTFTNLYSHALREGIRCIAKVHGIKIG